MRKMLVNRPLFLVALVVVGMVMVGSTLAVGAGPLPDRLQARPQGSLVTQPATAWREVWNGQGTFYAADVVPTAATTHLWAVGDAGRLLRTTDGGRTWRFSRVPGRPTLYALDIVDAARAFAVGEGGTLLTTTDGGDSWAPLDFPSTQTLRTLDVAGEALWVGGDDGLWYSNDGGTTWQTLLTTPVRAWARSSQGWAAGTADGRVFLSTDGGATWQSHALSAGPINALAWAGDTLYAAGQGGFLARLAAGAATWTPISTGRTDDIFALAPAADGSLWAVGYGGWAYHIVGSRVDTVRANGEFRVLYDVVRPAADVIWTVGDGPDVWRSDDRGQTWVLQNGGRLKNLYEVDFVDELTGWAVGERERAETYAGRNAGVVFHTTDGGETWGIQPIPEDPANAYDDYGWFWGLDCVDAQHCWISGRYGRVYHTSDGGQTWERQRTGVSGWLYEITFPSTRWGYVGRTNGNILRTTDGGKTWTQTPPAIGMPIRGIDAYDEKKVIAVSSQGQLLVSHTGGAWWARKSVAPYTVNFTAVTWVDENIAWVVGTYGYLAFSPDGGNTWEYKEGGGSNHYRDWWGIEFAPDREMGVIVGGLRDRPPSADPEFDPHTGGLLALTLNRGKDWTYYTTDTPGTLRDVRVLNRNRAWAVGDAGTILVYRGEPSRTFALPAPAPPTVDGETWDWTVSNALVLDGNTADDVRGARPTGEEDIALTLRPWWDGDALYLLADVVDDRVQVGDELVLYIDGLGNGGEGNDDVTLRVAAPATGTVQAQAEPSVAARITAAGWRAEVSIPAAQLGGDFRHDRTLRWTVVLVDSDPDGTSVLTRDGRDTQPGPEFGYLTLLGNEVVIQKGLNAYSDSADCWIWRMWGENTQNQCSVSKERARVLYVESKDGRASLLRFDVSPLPAGVDVTQAALRLYATGVRGGSAPLPVAAYPLRREWLFDQVTWEEAQSGDPWGAPGANDTTVDRWATPVSTITVDATEQWFEWDVTEAVRRWVEGLMPNYGIILKDASTGDNPPYALFEFVGEQHAVAPYDEKHPMLVIRYAVPTPNVPTPTPTPSPTPTPPPTPTPTPTPTPVPMSVYVPLVIASK